MKKLFLSAAAVLFGLGAFAQTQPLGYGIKAGVNFPSYHITNSDMSDFKSTTNFHVTGFLDAPLGGNFYLQPGISLQGKGAKFVDTEDLEMTQNTMWLEVPVNAVAKLPTGATGNFFVGAGPYVAFGLSGKNKVSGGDSSLEHDFKFGKDEDMKGVDFGLNFMAGYQLSSGLSLGAGYGLGLADIAPENDSDSKLTNRVFSISLGFAL